MMKKFQVVFQPSGTRGEVLEGKNILEASRELGAEVESVCGGIKACGKCKVQLVEGRLSPFTDEESKSITELEKADGFRLGCGAQIEGDALIFVPEESRAGKTGGQKGSYAKSDPIKTSNPTLLRRTLPAFSP